MLARRGPTARERLGDPADTYPVSNGAAVLTPPNVAQTERRHRFEELYAAHRISLLAFALRRFGCAERTAQPIQPMSWLKHS
jgi:hypothetical protein